MIESEWLMGNIPGSCANLVGGAGEETFGQAIERGEETRAQGV
jgi:hypothetical protein